MNANQLPRKKSELRNCFCKARFLVNASFLVVLAVLFGICLTGCSTAALTSGTNLAKVGQTASLQMEQNATLSGNSILALKKAVAFNDGYNGLVGNSDSKAFLVTISDIQGHLAQYGKWLESLSSSYSALGDLATYDAVGNFDSSIGALATNTTQFASDIGKPIEISSEVTSSVKGVGGFFIGSIQASKVKDASHKIEILLTNIIAALEDPNTKKQLITIQGEVTGQIDQAATVLFDNGMCSYAPLLDDLGSPLALKSISTSDEILRKAGNEKVLAGLRNVAVELAQEQISSQAASYDKSLAALKALVPLHESLQNDAPLNLDSIKSITSQLQSIAATFQPIIKK